MTSKKGWDRKQGASGRLRGVGEEARPSHGLWRAKGGMWRATSARCVLCVAFCVSCALVVRVALCVVRDALRVHDGCALLTAHHTPPVRLLLLSEWTPISHGAWGHPSRCQCPWGWHDSRHVQHPDDIQHSGRSRRASLAA